MVPASFVTFFSVMAGVGATLFGLIFLAVSIKPEIASAEKAAVMRQVQVSSSYAALINPLLISLFALKPQATIGTITLCMSAVGLVNTVIMGVSLIQDARSWAKKLKSIFFIAASLIIYGFEIFYAFRLSITPGDAAALSDLATLLILIYLYGIGRAWDLIGERQFHLRDLYMPLVPQKIEAAIADKLYAEDTKDAKESRE